MNFLWKTISLTLLILLSFCNFCYCQNNKTTSPIPQFKEGNIRYYAIKTGESLIGYSVYKVDRKMQLAGEHFTKIQALSVLRLGMGEIQESIFKSDLSLSSKTLLPSYFTIAQQTGESQILSELLFSRGLIAQTNLAGKNQENNVHETDNECYLFFSNLWGKLDSFVEHYNILIMASNNAKESQFNIYDPILKTEGRVRLVKEGKDYIKTGSKSYSAQIYTVYDLYNMPILKIWYDSESSKILKMNEIGGKITFELTDKSVENELKKSPGVDLWQNKITMSPIYIQDKSRLDMLSVTLSLNGRGLSCAPHEVLGFSQKFEGEYKHNSITGTFVVKKTPIQIDKPNKFPPSNISDDIRQFLEQEPGIESKNDYIVNKAQEVTWKSRDSLSAARKLAGWIKDNIKQGVSMPSALTAFNSGIANPESRALLLTALSRAAGIPARMAGGIVFDKGSFIPGYWCEIYIENNGWVPFDPERGGEQIDVARVYLWEFGELTGIKIDNVDFLPKPPKRIAHHQKDISWPVGEERIFEIRKGGKIIGQEKAVMSDFGVSNGIEVYTLKSDSVLKIGKSLFKASAVTQFTPYALPVSFTSKSGIGDIAREETFKFTDKYIENIIPDSSGNMVIRNIPYSVGAYIMDQRYISLWALAIGQIPKVELDKKYSFNGFVPEEIKTIQIEVEAKNFQKIEAAGEELNVFKCESKKGLIFYIDQSGRVVKVDIPAQDLEFTLTTQEIDFNALIAEPSAEKSETPPESELKEKSNTPEEPTDKDPQKAKEDFKKNIRKKLDLKEKKDNTK